MSRVTAEQRAKAEIYVGDALCRETCKLLLQRMGLPTGLLPVEDIVEAGHVEETGFVWIVQKKKKEHRFEKINRLVSYATEVTAYVEKFKIKKLTGVKVKEILWLTLSEIHVDNPPTGKLTCKTSIGLFRTFPTEAFELKEK